MTSQALKGQTSQELGRGLAGPAPQPALCTADLGTPLHAAAFQPGGLAQPWLCRRGQVHTDLTQLRAALGLSRFARRCTVGALHGPLCLSASACSSHRLGRVGPCPGYLLWDLRALGYQPCKVCYCIAYLVGLGCEVDYQFLKGYVSGLECSMHLIFSSGGFYP